MSMRTRLGVLVDFDFRQLFLADTVSQLGTQVTQLALPLVAVLALHASAFEVGLLAAADTAAFLIVGLPAGALVDRLRRRNVMIAGDLARAILLGSVPFAWWMGWLSMPQLYLVGLGTGLATVFFDVAYQSYLPDLVDQDDISEGNAKLQASQSVAMIGGPAMAGGLIKLMGAPLTIAIDALSFLCSAFFIRRIDHLDTPPPRENRRSLAVEIREGLAFVLKNPLLWRITASTGISNFFSNVTGVMLVLFCIRDLGLAPGDIGIAMGLGAAGGLLGALLTPRINRIVGEGRTIPMTALFWVPAGLMMPLAGTYIPPMVALTVSSLLLTFAVVVYNVTQVSFRQRLCPRPLLGRMNASIRFLVWGVMPIGAFVGGVLGEQVGPRNVFWIGLVGSALAALPVLFSPLVRMRDLPREMQQLT